MKFKIMFLPLSDQDMAQKLYFEGMEPVKLLVEKKGVGSLLGLKSFNAAWISWL